MKAGLKRFSNHIFLKRLGRDLLTHFLSRFPELEAHSSHWSHVSPESNASHSTLAAPSSCASGLDFYSSLAAFFLRPERLPAGMMEELLAIEEMSTPDGLTRLERAAEWPDLERQLRPDSTAEDIAMQVWLLAP